MAAHFLAAFLSRSKRSRVVILLSARVLQGSIVALDLAPQQHQCTTYRYRRGRARVQETIRLRTGADRGKNPDTTRQATTRRDGAPAGRRGRYTAFYGTRCSATAHTHDNMRCARTVYAQCTSVVALGVASTALLRLYFIHYRLSCHLCV